MTTDEEFIHERRQADELDYLRNAIDPEYAPRIAPALIAIRRTLADATHPVPHASVLAVGLRSSDIAVSTLDNMIRKLTKHGFITKHGEYVSNRYKRGVKDQDKRGYTLGSWELTR